MLFRNLHYSNSRACLALSIEAEKCCDVTFGRLSYNCKICVFVMIPTFRRNDTPFMTFLNNSDPFKECIAGLTAGKGLQALLCREKKLIKKAAGC